MSFQWYKYCQILTSVHKHMILITSKVFTELDSSAGTCISACHYVVPMEGDLNAPSLGNLMDSEI